MASDFWRVWVCGFCKKPCISSMSIIRIAFISVATWVSFSFNDFGIYYQIIWIWPQVTWTDRDGGNSRKEWGEKNHSKLNFWCLVRLHANAIRKCFGLLLCDIMSRSQKNIPVWSKADFGYWMTLTSISGVHLELRNNTILLRLREDSIVDPLVPILPQFDSICKEVTPAFQS